MPRSPTSSEDEMAQSFSDYSDDCASDSSREETIYETIRATAEPSQNRMDDIHTNSLVIRVLIPDLQQTELPSCPHLFWPGPAQMPRRLLHCPKPLKGGQLLTDSLFPGPKFAHAQGTGNPEPES
ncbi:SH3 and multiple ankyrin repeat domains protein 2-like isoform X2 [Epinephelus moara]|nr:SH3 and multiple ankyrin repeat domains protein 2-like isoform X2 [Epinephelus moara]